MSLRHGGSSPGIFDREVVVPKCQVNRYGQANCAHVHARDLPSQNALAWAGEPEDLVAPSWTAQNNPRDPRLGKQLYECGLCRDTMTLEETQEHACA